MGIKSVPTIKDYRGMNIINGIVYCVEAIKRETDIKKKELLIKRLEVLKIELEEYKAA